MPADKKRKLHKLADEIYEIAKILQRDLQEPVSGGGPCSKIKSLVGDVHNLIEEINVR